MTSRRTQSVPPAAAVAYMEKMPKTRGRCVSAICVSWKVFTCVFSHVLLVTTVVAYCLLGAKTFEYLEKKNEIEVKKSISFIRGNLTEGIWQMTTSQPVLYEQNWTQLVIAKLQTFETDILNSMKIQGWDGNEDTDKLQWTFMGALFYSIIVITTIGYGHIAPKTFIGKISTIFYAILGIPLMLLCLSNIGDIMASSFRFIYWRVCCFVCTREPRRHSVRRPRRPALGPPMAYGEPPPAGVYRVPSQQPRHLSAKSNPSMRRSIRISQRTTDSGLGNSYHEAAQLHHAHSDTELRYSDQRSWDRNANSKSTLNKNPHQQPRFGGRSATREPPPPHSDRHTVERERNVTRQPGNVSHAALPVENHYATMSPANRRRSTNPRRYGRSQSMAPPELGLAGDTERNTMTLPASYGRNKQKGRSVVVRAQSLDPRDRNNFRTASVPFDDDGDCKTPVLCNKYAIEELDKNGPPGIRRPLRTAPSHGTSKHRRCQSMPRQPSGGGVGRYGQRQSQPPPSQQQQQQPQSPKGTTERNRYLDVSQPSDDYYDRKLQPQHTQHQPQHQHQQQQHRMSNVFRGGSVDNYRQPTNHRLHQQQQQQQRRMRGQQLYRDEDNDSFDDDDDDDDVDDADVVNDIDDGDVERGQNGRRVDRIDDDHFEMHPIRKHHRRRERQAPPPPSPRIMTPMGFAIHRQARLQSAYAADDDSQYGDGDWDYSDQQGSRVRPVPIWLCVFLVVGYILAGAYLFSMWEKWSFLDSAYFCFITLTTIGFGDFVPAQGVKENPEMSIAFCSLYLLFGIALLAMSFNLVQEEVIANVKNVARQLGILKEEEVYY